MSVETWADIVQTRPKNARTASLDAPWTRERLWRVDLPAEPIDVERFQWILDLPMWRHRGVPFTLSPSAVLREPAAYPDHSVRIEAADLGFPIHVTPWQGNLIVLDGLHRLAKARSLGILVVSAKVLPESAQRLIVTARV
jgi:hypothetical protein